MRIKPSTIAVLLIYLCAIPLLVFVLGLTTSLADDGTHLFLQLEVSTQQSTASRQEGTSIRNNKKQRRSLLSLNTKLEFHHRLHHAILVPHQNNASDVEKFMSIMGPYLSRHFPNDDFTLLALEQRDNGPFNKGMLVNVGITEIVKRAPATHCVILHDFDLIPKFLKGDSIPIVPYNNCSMPMQLSSESQRFNFSVPHPKNCGGVISMHLHDWQAINGMSNGYRGRWGGEEDDLYLRLRISKLLFGKIPVHYKNSSLKNAKESIIMRPPKGQGIFVNLDTENQAVNHTAISGNIRPTFSKKFHKKRYMEDGLSDLNYNITSENPFSSTGFFQASNLKIIGHGTTTNFNKIEAKQTRVVWRREQQKPSASTK